MKFAVIHNWPGQKNSEYELITRIARIAAELGHECVMIDPFGHQLNADGTHINETGLEDLRSCDFCLSLHYVNPNIFDTFSYCVNWNPLDYVMRNPMDGEDLALVDMTYRAACLDSHDALLSAGSEEMDDFTASLGLLRKHNLVNDKLRLHTTSEVHEDLGFPDFSDFRVFYIGVNWERQEGVDRHGRLIEMLDATNLVQFYGVSRQFGFSAWDGVKNYKGELPFDGGKSIVQKSSECGVSLVLHSAAHRKSGLVSTRLFQACASKTLTICDDNPFILKHFGDSVLSFKYGSDPEENFRLIMEKIDWVRNHPDKALQKAEAAHAIFAEKFCLRKELVNLFDNHQGITRQFAEQFCAQDSSTRVDVLYANTGDRASALEVFFKDMRAQTGVQPRAVVFTSPGHLELIKKLADKYKTECEVIECGDREGAEPDLPFDGRMVSRYLQGDSHGACFTFYSRQCRWKSAHLSLLARALEDSESVVSLAGAYVRNQVFSLHPEGYYDHQMKSISADNGAITEQDFGIFAANKFPASFFMFSTAGFLADAVLLRSLRFFDKGWAFYLAMWNYLQTQNLPAFVPKLSVVYLRNDRNWGINSYSNGRQSLQFESSLAHVFFKNSPVYLSLVQSGSGVGSRVPNQPSLNEYMHGVLRNRRVLLKMYLRLFKMTCSVLRIKYVEVLPGEESSG